LSETKALADLAPKPVARNGIARGFHRDCQPDARVCKTVGFYAQREEAIIDASPTSVDRIELQFAAQTQLRTET
jgi:hypothetical protein